MPRFTTYQYDEAIKNLQDAKKQLEPDGNCCQVCGDSGHQAFECGFNPLVAMVICKAVAKGAEEIHQDFHGKEDNPLTEHEIDRVHHFLHWLAGYEFHMGLQCGPAKVIVSPVSKEEDPNAEK